MSSDNKTLPRHPAMIASLNEHNKIELLCEWPMLNTKEDEEVFAKHYADLITTLFKRDIMQYIQTGIVVHGVKSNRQRLSNLILVNLNLLLNPVIVTDNNSPIISPKAAFQSRGNN